MGRVYWKRERWVSKETPGKLGGRSDAGNTEEPSMKRRLVSPGSPDCPFSLGSDSGRFG